MTRIAIDPARPVGRLDRKVFGGFVATFIGSPAMNLYEAGLSADGASGTRPAVALGSQRLDLPGRVWSPRRGSSRCWAASSTSTSGSTRHKRPRPRPRWRTSRPRRASWWAAPRTAWPGSIRTPPVKPGGRVTFTVDPARLYFFDPDTGQAITG